MNKKMKEEYEQIIEKIKNDYEIIKNENTKMTM